MSESTVREDRSPGEARELTTEHWQDCTICAIFFKSKVITAIDIPLVTVNETRLQTPPPALIKLARKLLDLTQADLAKLAGVSLRTLVDVEREEREPMRATMARLRLSLEERGARFFGDAEKIGVYVLPSGPKGETGGEGTRRKSR